MSATQTQEEQLQEKRVEKMMRAAAKDVHKIRGQSRKEVPEVQTFRWGREAFYRILDRMIGKIVYLLIDWLIFKICQIILMNTRDYSYTAKSQW